MGLKKQTNKREQTSPSPPQPNGLKTSRSRYLAYGGAFGACTFRGKTQCRSSALAPGAICRWQHAKRYVMLPVSYRLAFAWMWPISREGLVKEKGIFCRLVLFFIVCECVKKAFAEEQLGFPANSRTKLIHPSALVCAAHPLPLSVLPPPIYFWKHLILVSQARHAHKGSV